MIHQIIIFTGSPTSHIETASHIAEIIIALGTIFGSAFSIWFSLKSLKKSEWNSNMATVPSLTLSCDRIHFWITDNQESDHGSWGEPRPYLTDSEDYIRMELDFSILNQGRGVALSIRRPNIKCETAVRIKSSNIPSSLGINTDENGNLVIYITELYSTWRSLLENPFKIEINIEYSNDQGNISCRSVWSAQIKPFDIETERLKIKNIGERIFEENMKVIYT